MHKPSTLFETGLSIPALSMKPYWRVRISGPHDDLDRIFSHMIKVHDFPYGKTDHNASVSAEGLEYYRPMADTPTGAETETRKRPHIVEMSVSIEPNQELLEKLLEIIYQFHSYYEPPISVEPILRSATRGLDDSDNPNRWWNKGGDWKKSSTS